MFANSICKEEQTGFIMFKSIEMFFFGPHPNKKIEINNTSNKNKQAKFCNCLQTNLNILVGSTNSITTKLMIQNKEIHPLMYTLLLTKVDKDQHA